MQIIYSAEILWKYVQMHSRNNTAKGFSNQIMDISNQKTPFSRNLNCCLSKVRTAVTTVKPPLTDTPCKWTPPINNEIMAEKPLWETLIKFTTVESRFLEPPRETKISSRN